MQREFEITMSQSLIEAMNLIRDGEWDAAHQIVQDLTSPQAARIHAHLHRIEGDDGNAGYWYRQAGVEFPAVSIDEEWQQIFAGLASDNH